MYKWNAVLFFFRVTLSTLMDHILYLEHILRWCVLSFVCSGVECRCGYSGLINLSLSRGICHGKTTHDMILSMWPQSNMHSIAWSLCACCFERVNTLFCFFLLLNINKSILHSDWATDAVLISDTYQMNAVWTNYHAINADIILWELGIYWAIIA